MNKNTTMNEALSAASGIRELLNQFQEDLNLEELRAFLEIMKRTSLLVPRVESDLIVLEEIEKELEDLFRILHLLLFKSLISFFSSLTMGEFTKKYGQAAIVVLQYLEAQDMYEGEIDNELLFEDDFWYSVLAETYKNNEFRREYLLISISDHPVISNITMKMKERVEKNLEVKLRSQEVQANKNLLSDFNELCQKYKINN